MSFTGRDGDSDDMIPLPLNDPVRTNDPAQAASSPLLSRPLLLTADPLLLDDVVRLGAAAGVDISVRDLPAVSAWSSAPLVLVGSDVLDATVARALPRRDGVIVVRRRDRGSSDEAPITTWRGAVSLGAEHVVDVPDGDRWMVDRLAELADAPASGGPVISCVAGVGGAGASTVAGLLARESRGLLVDIDPYGSAVPVDGGVRWPDLSATRGRVPVASLRGALPTVHGIHVLTGTAESHFTVPIDALVAVLDAGARGFACTLVDTPRCDGDATRAAWARSDLVIVVIGPDPHTVARVPALIEGIREVCTQVGVVARLGPRDTGTWCAAEAQEWDSSFLGLIRHERALTHGDHLFHTPRSTARSSARALLAAAAPGVVASGGGSR